MDDRQLKTFIQIADIGSFSASEKQMYISKQAMLKQINSLEDELGFKLFIRKHNGVELSEQGKIFYEGSKKLLIEKENLIHECLQIKDKNYLRIGSTDHQTFLDPVNTEFQKQYPFIKLKRIIHPNHAGEWRVDNDIQDIAEAFDLNLEQFHHCSFIPLQKRNYCAVFSKKHPLCQSKKNIPLDLLKEYKTIVFPLMMKPEIMDALQEAYQDTNHLILSDDLDHQLDILYQCIDHHEILISANPFIDSIEEVVSIPIDPAWSVEYGLLYRPPLTSNVKKYIEVAKKIFEQK